MDPLRAEAEEGSGVASCLDALVTWQSLGHRWGIVNTLTRTKHNQWCLPKESYQSEQNMTEHVDSMWMYRKGLFNQSRP